MSTPNTDSRMTWEGFAEVVAECAGVAPGEVRRETRLVEDLNLDSLELAEILVELFVDHGLEGLPEDLQESTWNEVTAGELYEAYLAYPVSQVQLEWLD